MLLASRIARSKKCLIEAPQGLEHLHVDSALRWLAYMDGRWFKKYRAVLEDLDADLQMKNLRRPLPSVKEDVSRYLVKVHEWRAKVTNVSPGATTARNEVLGLFAQEFALVNTPLTSPEEARVWQGRIENAGTVADVLEVLGYDVDSVDDFVVDYCAVQDMLSRRRWTRSGYGAQVDDWLDLVILDAASMVSAYGPNAWPVLVDVSRGWKAARGYEQLRRADHE